MRLVGRYIFLVVALTLSSALRAQEVCDASYSSTTNHDISIYYENNVATPRWSYADNSNAYKALVERVKHLAPQQTDIVVIIEGAASPVGSEAYNFRLALQRANTLRDIIHKMEGGERLRIRTVSAGEDWVSFQSYIEERYQEPNREKVLAILRADMSNDAKELQLQALDNGRTWRKLVREFMASSRNAAVIHIVEIGDLIPQFQPLNLRFAVAAIEPDAMSIPNFKIVALAKRLANYVATERPKDKPEVMPKFEVTPEPDVTPEPEVTLKPEVTPEPETVPTPQLRKPVVAVRSNLLVPALNIGLEVPIGTNWSVGADYYYPWVWPKSDNKNCFEFLGWGIEGRYWFGKNRTIFDRLQGHSVGLYGYVGYYDFERSFQGHQGEFVNIGVDYTYAMAVGKKRAVHFEFSLGVGYIYSQARKYTVIESHGPLISDKMTKRIGFFGPTKANISLVVPIFQKVKPNDKHHGNE